MPIQTIVPRVRSGLRDLLVELLEGKCTYMRLSQLDFVVQPDRGAAEIWLHVIEIFENDLDPIARIRPSPDLAVLLNKCIDFLGTDSEYNWPTYPRPDIVHILFVATPPFVLCLLYAWGFSVAALAVLIVYGAWLQWGNKFFCTSYQQKYANWLDLPRSTRWPFRAEQI